MRRYHNHRGTGGGVGRCRGAVVGLGEAVMLGEVGQGLVVVLENDAVTKAIVNGDHTGDGGIVQIEGEQVSCWDVNEAETTILNIFGNVLVKQDHARRALVVHQELLDVDSEGIGI